MVATVINSNLDRLRSFSSLYPMCQLKNIHKLACLFAVACVLMGQSLADDQDFMEEFLKREYSLAKPYRGEFTVSYVTLTQTFNVHSAKPR